MGPGLIPGQIKIRTHMVVGKGGYLHHIPAEDAKFNLQDIFLIIFNHL